MAVIETKLYCSTPIRSTLFKVVFCLVERVIEEINMMVQGFSAILIYGEEKKRSRGRRKRY
jgi:hypothetical protein